MRQIVFALAVFFLSTSVFASEPKQNNKTYEYRLSNGLILIVREDHRAPVAIASYWYKVGSSYEHNGITGISHALEHMMYRGTSNVPGGEFDKMISSSGGRQNAMTSADYTMFYQILPVDKLALSFRLEADRMKNLLVADEPFSKEISVVREERRLRTDDNPQGLTLERFNATAYVNNPYHNPVVGWMTDLMNMRAQDVRDWYHQWYAPNNAVIVVVGDVAPLKILELVRQYFGLAKPSLIPKLNPRTEVVSLGKRYVEVKAPAQLPWLVMGYNVPSLKTAKQPWRPYALELLAGILDAGNSSRLAKNLVRDKQIAVSADAEYDMYRLHGGLFSVVASPTMKHSVNDLQKAILLEIKDLKNNVVSQKELDRVKAQIIASKTFDKDSLMNQAADIGVPEALGLSWHDSDEFVRRIEAVTPEQIQQAAKRYLKISRLTIGVLRPQMIKGSSVKPSVPSSLPRQNQGANHG